MDTPTQTRASNRERDTTRSGDAASIAADARERLIAWMPVTERRLDLAGVSTAVLEGGAGSPVVLLHGPFANAGHWLRVVPGLAASHRVIVPDLPGHGASQATDAALTVPGIVTWLAELIARTCASPPVLVGQTLGGAIVARFASRNPAAIRRLVLIDSFGLAPFQLPPEFAQALTEFVSQPTETTHEALWQYCAFDLERLRARMAERWDTFRAYNLQLARTDSVRSAAATLIQALTPAIPVEELARITVPVTLAWGRHDLATPLAAAETASAQFGWPLQVIEDAADDPPVEQPDAVLRILRTAAAESDRD